MRISPAFLFSACLTTVSATPLESVEVSLTHQQVALESIELDLHPDLVDWEKYRDFVMVPILPRELCDQVCR